MPHKGRLLSFFSPSPKQDERSGSGSSGAHDTTSVSPKKPSSRQPSPTTTTPPVAKENSSRPTSASSRSSILSAALSPFQSLSSDDKSLLRRFTTRSSKISPSNSPVEESAEKPTAVPTATGESNAGRDGRKTSIALSALRGSGEGGGLMSAMKRRLTAIRVLSPTRASKSGPSIVISEEEDESKNEMPSRKPSASIKNSVTSLLRGRSGSKISKLGADSPSERKASAVVSPETAAAAAAEASKAAEQSFRKSKTLKRWRIVRQYVRDDFAAAHWPVILESDPKNPTAHALYGRYLNSLSDSDGDELALSHLETARKLGYDKPRIRVDIARTLYALWRQTEDVTYLKRCYDAYVFALLRFENMTSETLYDVAQVYMDYGSLDGALSILQFVISHKKCPILFSAILSAAAVQFRGKKYRAAAQSLDALLGTGRLPTPFTSDLIHLLMGRALQNLEENSPGGSRTIAEEVKMMSHFSQAYTTLSERSGGLGFLMTGKRNRHGRMYHKNSVFNVGFPANSPSSKMSLVGVSSGRNSLLNSGSTSGPSRNGESSNKSVPPPAAPVLKAWLKSTELWRQLGFGLAAHSYDAFATDAFLELERLLVLDQSAINPNTTQKRVPFPFPPLLESKNPSLAALPAPLRLSSKEMEALLSCYVRMNNRKEGERVAVSVAQCCCRNLERLTELHQDFPQQPNVLRMLSRWRWSLALTIVVQARAKLLKKRTHRRLLLTKIILPRILYKPVISRTKERRRAARDLFAQSVLPTIAIKLAFGRQWLREAFWPSFYEYFRKAQAARAIQAMVRARWRRDASRIIQRNWRSYNVRTALHRAFRLERRKQRALELERLTVAIEKVEEGDTEMLRKLENIKSVFDVKTGTAAIERKLGHDYRVRHMPASERARMMLPFLSEALGKKLIMERGLVGVPVGVEEVRGPLVQKPKQKEKYGTRSPYYSASTDKKRKEKEKQHFKMRYMWLPVEWFEGEKIFSVLVSRNHPVHSLLTSSPNSDSEGEDGQGNASSSSHREERQQSAGMLDTEEGLEKVDTDITGGGATVVGDEEEDEESMANIDFIKLLDEKISNHRQDSIEKLPSQRQPRKVKAASAKGIVYDLPPASVEGSKSDAEQSYLHLEMFEKPIDRNTREIRDDQCRPDEKKVTNESEMERKKNFVVANRLNVTSPFKRKSLPGLERMSCIPGMYDRLYRAKRYVAVIEQIRPSIILLERRVFLDTNNLEPKSPQRSSNKVASLSSPVPSPTASSSFPVASSPSRSPQSKKKDLAHKTKSPAKTQVLADKSDRLVEEIDGFLSESGWTEQQPSTEVLKKQAGKTVISMQIERSSPSKIGMPASSSPLQAKQYGDNVELKVFKPSSSRLHLSPVKQTDGSSPTKTRRSISPSANRSPAKAPRPNAPSGKLSKSPRTRSIIDSIASVEADNNSPALPSSQASDVLQRAGTNLLASGVSN